MNEIRVYRSQLERARALMAEAVEIGANGTDGDYTDSGLLAELFQRLDIKVVDLGKDPQTYVGSDA